MSEMSPAEVAAYRDAQLTAMGLSNDGTGNYYSPEYYAARPAALAANAANTAATASSGAFSGVQGPGPGAPSQAATMQPRPMAVPGAQGVGGLTAIANQVAGNGMGLGNGFGGGEAHSGFSPEQTGAISGAWNDFTSGKRDAASIRADMTKFGVNYADIAALTGLPVSVVMMQLNGQPLSSSGGAGNVPVGTGGVEPGAGAGGYPAYGGGQTGYPTQPRPGGITQYPAMTPRPSALPGTGGAPATYFPQRWWDRQAAQGFAEGGAVSYNPERIDSIYNQLKAQVNG